MTTANKQFHDPDMKNESKLSIIDIIQMLVFQSSSWIHSKSIHYQYIRYVHPTG
jgi:hypothetical protein